MSSFVLRCIYIKVSVPNKHLIPFLCVKKWLRSLLTAWPHCDTKNKPVKEGGCSWRILINVSLRVYARQEYTLDTHTQLFSLFDDWHYDVEHKANPLWRSGVGGGGIVVVHLSFSHSLYCCFSLPSTPAWIVIYMGSMTWVLSVTRWADNVRRDKQWWSEGKGKLMER